MRKDIIKCEFGITVIFHKLRKCLYRDMMNYVPIKDVLLMPNLL